MALRRIRKGAPDSTGTPFAAETCLSILRLAIGKQPGNATLEEKTHALALALRTYLRELRATAEPAAQAQNGKTVHYLSMDYLPGRLLQSTILNLNIEEEVRPALQVLGMELEEAYAAEKELALGRAHPGQAAASFLDSLANLGYPAYGYGLRYAYGMFRQSLADGKQVEQLERGPILGNPWESIRLDEKVIVRFHGYTRHAADTHGRYRVTWEGAEEIQAIPFEMLIPGYRNRLVNPLFLWSARGTSELPRDLGHPVDYATAVQQKEHSELVSKLLFPEDNGPTLRELRLKQHYFLVSAALQKILRDFLKKSNDLKRLPDQVAIQLNDTPPVLAIPEMMRLLVDVHGVPWESAWSITVAAFTYTSHSMLPESHVKWEVSLVGRLLPRHMEIIYEINRRFLETVAVHFHGDLHRIRALSLIEEERDKTVRMTHLAVVGSHAINGVSALHSQLLREKVMRDFNDLWPAKFHSVTDGINHRRWLCHVNPGLAQLITDAIGEGWLRQPDELKKLEGFADDHGFQDTWDEIRQSNKQQLATHLLQQYRLHIDPGRILETQANCFHPYQRQLLNLLGLIARYVRLRESKRTAAMIPRTVLLTGTAAPDQPLEKLLLQFACDVGTTINADTAVEGKLQVVFLPDYSLPLAEHLVPATDLALQFATAGKAAAGMGTMKFALNGAVLYGTLDGVMAEIRARIGEANLFLFGLTEAEISARRMQGYNPRQVCDLNPELKHVIRMIESGLFAAGATDRYQPILNRLFQQGDPDMVLADFAAHIDCQARVDIAYRTHREWIAKSIRTIANMGFFVSDRTVREYAETIWQLPPLPPPG